MDNLKEYDAIVIGAGFAGAVISRVIAEEKNKKVLLIDKRDHIGGNMYEMYDTNGVRIHLYGPHIFHTNNEKVFEYLKRFSDFYKYEHKVIGKIDGNLVSIPFNYTSLDILFEKEKAELIKQTLKKEFPNELKVSILDLINSDNKIVKEFGNYVYEKVFANYTAKQWGIPVSQIDSSVINRVPVVLGYDDRYFNDSIQYMPKDGFTTLFENMLNNENIDIKLNTNVKDILKLDFNTNKVKYMENEFKGDIFFSGAIDELLDFKYGRLPYRSLNLVFEQYKMDNYQTNSVVNYPNDEKFTRITEFKYLTNQVLKGETTILKEYPQKFDANDKKCKDPYYPIKNDENLALYAKYENDIEKFKNIHLCGRLAEYKYYNMDAVIDKALNLSRSVVK